MKELTRHFVAPRLGRGIVTAKLNNDGSSAIEIVFGIGEAGGETTISFYATAHAVEYLNLAKADRAFFLARIAISQTQRRLKGVFQYDNESLLDVTILPWKGDLTELPYGGATIGYAHLIEEHNCVD